MIQKVKLKLIIHDIIQIIIKSIDLKPMKFIINIMIIIIFSKTKSFNLIFLIRIRYT